MRRRFFDEASALPLNLPLPPAEVADAIDRMLKDFVSHRRRIGRAALCAEALIDQLARDYRSGRAEPHQFSTVELRERTIELAEETGEQVSKIGKARADWFSGVIRNTKSFLERTPFFDPVTGLSAGFVLHEIPKPRNRRHFVLPDFGPVGTATAESDAARSIRRRLSPTAEGGNAVGADPSTSLNPPQLRSVRPPAEPVRVSTGSLIETSGTLVGRSSELAALNAAWANAHARVFGISAFAGSGKTALINTWLRDLEDRKYAGAQRVFAWSFYRAGKDALPAQSDEFFAAALTFFGDDAGVDESPWARAEKLAAHVCDLPSIVILDGIDAFQRPTGTLTDEALRVFFRELASRNPGLCVATTRYGLPFLGDFEKRGFVLLDLPPLDDDASIELLRGLGTLGPAEAFKAAAVEHKGHALSLELLATYLRETANGDVRAWREVLRFAADDDPIAGNATARLLRAYEEHLRDTPELSILRLLGLFDEPVSIDVLQMLADPPLSFARALEKLPTARIRRAVTRLRDLRIITAAHRKNTDLLDTHPLVRAHFAVKLESEDAESWQEGNRRLFEHVSRTTEPLPDTIDRLGRLYAAVRFGCRAGRHSQALGLFRERILRGRSYYSTRVLGALSADLAAMQYFFRSPWDAVTAALSADDAAWVSYEAGFRLRGIGRFREARRAMERSLVHYRSTGDLANAAKAAGNIAEVYVIEGKLNAALKSAREGDDLITRAAENPNRDDVPKRRAVRKSTIGYTLHQMGQFSEALAVFAEAEALESTMLSALRGYHYCDLLLDLNELSGLHVRATHLIEQARGSSIFEEALGLFVMARLAVAEGDLRDGVVIMERAVAQLRAAAQLHYLPPALLALASVCRVRGDEVRARALVDDVIDMTQHSPMPLHQIDAHLELAQLFARTSEAAARKHLVTAERLILKRGYHRRARLLAELRGTLGKD